MTANRIRIKKSVGPFWRWTINFMVGCDQCLYCYNKRWNWARGSPRIKTDLSLLRKQAESFEWSPGPSAMCTTLYDVLTSSSHDPFHVSSLSTAVEILRLLANTPVASHLRVLTKMALFNPPRCGGLWGMTITTLNGAVARLLEPLASPPHERFNALQNWAQRGHKLWLSVEPMLEGMHLHDLIWSLERLGVHPQEVWAGRLNHRHLSTKAAEYALDDAEIVRQFEEARDSFPEIRWYLKREVRA